MAEQRSNTVSLVTLNTYPATSTVINFNAITATSHVILSPRTLHAAEFHSLGTTFIGLNDIQTDQCTITHPATNYADITFSFTVSN
jgi:hypothetical protein